MLWFMPVFNSYYLQERSRYRLGVRGSPQSLNWQKSESPLFHGPDYVIPHGVNAALASSPSFSKHFFEIAEVQKVKPGSQKETCPGSPASRGHSPRGKLVCLLESHKGHTESPALPATFPFEAPAETVAPVSTAQLIYENTQIREVIFR